MLYITCNIIHTDLDKLPLDIVVHEIDPLSFLAVVEALLRHVQGVLRLLQRLLQDALPLLQRVDLRDHTVRLIRHLCLPELDVAKALAQLLADVMLAPLRLLVRLAAQPDGVETNALRPAPHAV